MVERFEMSGADLDWNHTPDGEWVRHSDYAALEAQLAERVKGHEKLHRRAQVAEGRLHQAYNYIQNELGILRRITTTDGAWPMRGSDVYNGLSRILSALEATPPAP